MTKEERAASAERIIREPFYIEFLAEEKESVLSDLARAQTHEDLLRAQARHQAVSDLEAAVHMAAKR